MSKNHTRCCILFTVLSGAFGCASLGLTEQDAVTAVSARESVCSLARIMVAQAPTDETLNAVVVACDAGDDLKRVARVYGGCAE